MDNIEQMNKEVAEWLGICWHEFGKTTGYCINCGHNVPDTEDNPDFSQGAGIVRLLKEMKGKLDEREWARLIWRVGYCHMGMAYGDVRYLVDYEVITTPGKLLDAVAEWIKEHPK